MSVASTTVRVVEDSTLREHPFVGRSGEPCAWLNVGEDGELGVYGSPRAMRRLGEALLAVADAADALLGAERVEAVGGS